jgi:NAD(P)-dependent dehydrogenase (short-subunit alcohol dehydrogenase family)
MKSLKELMGLEGRVAVITGGAGHLGAAMTEALAELGCSICIFDRSSSNLHVLCEQLRAKWQVDAEALEIDLEQEEQRIKLPAQVAQRFGRVDIFVNNAAFVGDSTLKGWGVRFEDQRIDTWRRALEVNLTAAFHLSQLLTPQLRASGKGSIINIGSIYGIVGSDNALYEGTTMGNPAAYAASKGGVVQMTRWLSSVLAPEIRVNCISPGGIARGQPAAFVERYERRTPLGRMGREEDFKGAIAYFASDLSAWVTGENLMVDGGWTAW